MPRSSRASPCCRRRAGCLLWPWRTADLRCGSSLCQRNWNFACLTLTQCGRLDCPPMTDEALARRTVFVVDDSPLDRERTCAALRDEYATEAFADGSAVLERLTSGPIPDVVIL